MGEDRGFDKVGLVERAERFHELWGRIEVLMK